jgi:hypothetical protein
MNENISTANGVWDFKSPALNPPLIAGISHIKNTQIMRSRSEIRLNWYNALNFLTKDPHTNSGLGLGRSLFTALGNFPHVFPETLIYESKSFRAARGPKRLSRWVERPPGKRLKNCEIQRLRLANRNCNLCESTCGRREYIWVIRANIGRSFLDSREPITRATCAWL